ncbi:MAG TPA: carboxypeptidase regulatory-like domain-containing protein [Terracidiphilus sp.]|jgi:hypothetical protein
MRRIFAVFCLLAFAITLAAQSPAGSQAKAKSSAPKAQLAPPQVAPPKAQLAPPQVVKDLPVHKVVLYKNGVGYFEHAGSVTGNQRVTIDFTSPQLNDVLQSLTVLDEGGGRIAGVNYNSTTPLAEQLKTLSLGMTDDPTSTALFQALRGQRVEVTGGPGGTITGRLLSIETRTEKVSGGDTDTTIDKFYLTLIATSGAARVIELTPALSVRPLDANLQGQLDRYLELLSTTHANGLRHLTLDALGVGQRQLRVSYISEVPIWKSTYRIVFPRTPNGTATMQGWAVVDNTVGADWDNVQLSLVAGAPQSFIQPLSQPIYTRRVEIPIATEAQLTPQTHEAAEASGPGEIAGIVTDASGAVIPNASVIATSMATGVASNTRTGPTGIYDFASLPPGLYSLRVLAKGFKSFVISGVRVGAVSTARQDARLSIGTETETVNVVADALTPQADSNVVSTLITSEEISSIASENRNFADLAPLGRGVRSGNVVRASDAYKEGDVTTNAFDDFFEYALTQPVTIHKNESAMVPILQQVLPAEHVTLWSEKEPAPLRAVWLENKSSLTLDSGSFSIFESGEFAGEGLLDPIHPGEKRLLSYAADQAVRVKVTDSSGLRTLHHVQISKGVIIETYMDVDSKTYSAINSSDGTRDVLIEHPRHANGWELDGDLKAAESTPNLYRFRLPVPAHSTANLEVRERGPVNTEVRLNPNYNQSVYLLDLVKRAPDALDKLKPVIDAQTALADLDRRISESKKTENAASADEARDRENLTALKGNDAAKRFVDELNRAEDQLQAAHKQTTDLEQQKKAAVDKLNEMISQISFDWDVKAEK